MDIKEIITERVAEFLADKNHDNEDAWRIQITNDAAVYLMEFGEYAAEKLFELNEDVDTTIETVLSLIAAAVIGGINVGAFDIAAVQRGDKEEFVVVVDEAGCRRRLISGLASGKTVLESLSDTISENEVLFERTSLLLKWLLECATWLINRNIDELRERGKNLKSF